MKALNNKPRSLILALLACGALLGTGSAFAYYAPEQAPPAYGQPHIMPVSVSINIGWHGDRYWDGHRYWAHDDWMHRHPHARDPHRGHDRGHDHDFRRGPHQG